MASIYCVCEVTQIHTFLYINPTIHNSMCAEQNIGFALKLFVMYNYVVYAKYSVLCCKHF